MGLAEDLSKLPHFKSIYSRIPARYLPIVDILVGTILQAIQDEDTESAFTDPPPNIHQITSQPDLLVLRGQLGVRNDWHEPDNQGVTAKVFGESFDNAGFWPQTSGIVFKLSPEAVEQHVVLYKDDRPIAAVNLATLFAWATGYRGEG